MKRVFETSHSRDGFHLEVRDVPRWRHAFDQLIDAVDPCCRRPLRWLPFGLGYRLTSFAAMVGWKNHREVTRIAITPEQALAITPLWERDRWLWDEEAS